MGEAEGQTEEGSSAPITPSFANAKEFPALLCPTRPLSLPWPFSPGIYIGLRRLS